VKNVIFLLGLFGLYSCGNAGQDVAFIGNPIPTVQGIEKPSVGIDFVDIDPGLACAAGGVSIFSFYDNNSDKFYQFGEDIIRTKSICNGTNASITLESIVSSTVCPSGGIKISSSASTVVEVCNGMNGLNGVQGIAGTLVTPVKFCSTDNSTFAEYGLIIGDDLFAVYWGVTPASPKVAQASLVKLVSGNYMSTGGSNCLFTID
jgi:hypothetical protein